ncbi:MAG: peptidase U32 family protein [Oscillospiraceae bacterium]
MVEKKGIFPELLAPVGDWERLEAAVLFGADAVYLGGTMFGMRASAAKFGQEDMARAVEYCHSRNVRIYITLNVLPRNDEIPALEDYIRFLGEVGVDALIISDLGVFRMARRLLPDMDLHVSTQAGVVNYLAAREFCEMGAKRVVLARELSLEDIRTIRENTPPQLELEAFVHGAMCMSFSGRCLISQYLTGRDANHGECAQPCRWSYRLVEEKRQGEYYPVVEEEEGTYFFNAQDLNMLPWLDKLAEAGGPASRSRAGPNRPTMCLS